MTLSEFKAWFEGYTEEMEGPPSRKQWKKIQDKIKKISDAPTPWPIFVDRYIHPWRPHWDRVAWFAGQTAQSTASLQPNAGREAFLEQGRIEYRAGG